MARFQKGEHRGDYVCSNCGTQLIFGSKWDDEPTWWSFCPYCGEPLDEFVNEWVEEYHSKYNYGFNMEKDEY